MVLVDEAVGAVMVLSIAYLMVMAVLLLSSIHA